MRRRSAPVERGWKVCRSGKIRYRDIEDAKRALSRTREKTERDRLPTRYYRCPLCKGFHLTSQEG